MKKTEKKLFGKIPIVKEISLKEKEESIRIVAIQDSVNFLSSVHDSVLLSIMDNNDIEYIIETYVKEYDKQLRILLKEIMVKNKIVYDVMNKKNKESD